MKKNQSNRIIQQSAAPQNPLSNHPLANRSSLATNLPSGAPKVAQSQELLPKFFQNNPSSLRQSSKLTINYEKVLSALYLRKYLRDVTLFFKNRQLQQEKGDFQRVRWAVTVQPTSIGRESAIFSRQRTNGELSRGFQSYSSKEPGQHLKCTHQYQLRLQLKKHR